VTFLEATAKAEAIIAAGRRAILPDGTIVTVERFAIVGTPAAVNVADAHYRAPGAPAGAMLRVVGLKHIRAAS